MNISEIVKYAAVFLIFISSVVSVISALGIIRFPDVYTRIHAATKSTTLAVLLTLTGAFVYFWAAESFISVRLILGIIFVFLTAPVAGHLIIRAAYRSKVKLAESSIEDELKSALDDKE
ncbi:Na+/H+ antiporter subunit G [Lederbergia lenta]|uniref:Monovalent cation/H+ antiporter subunit G n=1 Tax=Lederbergia lenta TaxID=1467 RepID=A0A2X4VUX4_LEDLE|nr:Na+/H+ antiporter subunit G [Lederbergia lenta]MCM3111420.1 Na+/H+ antiporter subunit G [Lederbergia lenta]MEC2325194.1 Na+/H+ antiporter subunit G [Lederbergia lenta]SQI56047.1 monovalent cation/H+ antiporter subunit G [Lederbergia lenta]